MVRRGDRPHHALSARPVLPGRAVRHSACTAHTQRRLDGRLVWQAATDLCRYAGRRAPRNLEGTGFIDLPQNPGHAETPAALAGWRDIRPLLRRMISAEWPKSNLAQTVEGLARLSVDDIRRLRASGSLAAFELASQQVATGTASPEAAIATALEALSIYRQEVDRTIFDVLRRTSASGTEMTEDHTFVVSKQNRIKEELQAVGKFTVKTVLGKATLGVPHFC